MRTTLSYIRTITKGMDLALMDGELICRNEVYFDRVAIAPLFANS